MVEQIEDIGTEEQIGNDSPEVLDAFIEACPEYDADSAAVLTPQEREKILMERLSSPQGESQAEGQPERRDPEKPDDSRRPQSYEIPNLDVTGLQQNMLEMLNDMGADDVKAKRFAEALTGILLLQQDHVKNMGKLMVTVADELRDEAVVPMRWQRAVSSVPGATNEDVDAAKELMKKRGGTDMETALEVIVLRRGDNTKPKNVDNESLKKTIAALKKAREASTHTGGGRTGGAGGVQFTNDRNTRLALKQREAEEAAKKK